MTQPPARTDDKYIEQLIAALLRTGVLIAAGIVFTGGIMYLHHNHAAQPDFSVFDSDMTFRNLSNILASARLHNSQAIIQIGILVLIATPVLRVLFSVIAFVFERDGMYVFFSLTVLVILLFSIFHGAAI